MNPYSDIHRLPWRIGLSPVMQGAALLAGVSGGAAALVAAKYSLLRCGAFGVNALFYLAAVLCSLAVLWCASPRGGLADKLGIRRPDGKDVKTLLAGLAVIYLFHFSVSPLWGRTLHALGVEYAPSQDFLLLCRDATPWGFVALVAQLGVLIPVAEELFFRRLLFGVFRPLGALPALLLASLVFSALHFFLYGFWALWVLGMVFQWMYLRTGSFVTNATAHVVFNCVSLAATFFSGAD